MHIDYILAFTQAPVYIECYMKIPKVIELQSDTNWVLKAKKNIYGQRQIGRVWNELLVGKITSSSVRFRQSNIDECVLYQGKSIYILYTDYSILEGSDEEELMQIVSDIKDYGLDITEKEYIEDFLGVNIYKVDSET